MDKTFSEKPVAAFVLPDLSNGGAERAFFNIAMHFHKAGMKVHILASLTGQNVEKIPPEIKLFELGNTADTNSSSFLRVTNRIIKYLKVESPDVIICFSDYIDLSVMVAKKITQAHFKLIVSQQYHISSFLKELPSKNKILLRFIQKLWSSGANKIVAASDGVAKDIIINYKLKHLSKVTTIYNPIFEEKILSLAEEFPSENILFTGSTFKIITVGRLALQKDHPVLLKAFKLFIEKVSNAVLYIVGTGPLEMSLKSMAITLGIQEKVHFLGYKNNPYSYIAHSNLFVLSSLYEGFGNVLVEAMACGVNVVSTDCPSGPSEILSNGIYGYLCPVSNPQALCNAMQDSYNSPLPSKKLINRAKEFSIENNGEKYLQLANSIILLLIFFANIIYLFSN
ncbi:MAG: glycosyltransferase [Ferruginibacter sp.]